MTYDLFLDPGTITGWAIRDEYGKLIGSGTWNFKPRRGDGAGMRFLRLQWQLDSIRQHHRLRRLVYEQSVASRMHGSAADICAGLIATIQAWCEVSEVPYEAYAPAELKKAATGKGNANKDTMLCEAIRRFPDVAIEDHNHADALLLSVVARH